MSPLKRAPVPARRDPDAIHAVIQIDSHGQAHGSIRDSSEVSVDGPVTEVLGKLVSAVAASVGKPVGDFRLVLTTITADGERIVSPPLLGREDDYEFDDWADPRSYDLWFARHLYEHRLLASGEERVVDVFAVRIADHQLLAVPGTDVISAATVDDDDALDALSARVGAHWGRADGVQLRVFTACQVLDRWTLEAILKTDLAGMHAYLTGQQGISVRRGLDLLSAMLHQNPVRTRRSSRRIRHPPRRPRENQMAGESGVEGPNSPEERLTEAEREFLDAHSGTVDRPGAYEEAVARAAYLRATTVMPDVPHIAEVLAALAAADQSTDPVSVTGFVEYGRVEVPGTNETYTVREWLDQGRDPGPVLLLADQQKYSL
jgi:hypothetical protein